MHRRDFLKFLLSTPIAYQLDVEKLLWISGEKKIFIPNPILVKMYGVPYHQSNASMGTWLGFSRDKEVVKEIVYLVDICKQDAIKNQNKTR